MKIHIDDTRTINQVKQEFMEAFELLKLEFFVAPHQSGKGSNKSELIPNNTSLHSLRTKHTSGDLVITADMTVAQVESAFQDMFGLYAQVFRLSGKLWLETTVTDSWTLAQQMEQAAIMQLPAE